MWFRKFAGRYRKDFLDFLKAYLLCSIAIVPTVLFIFHEFSPFVYFYAWAFGLANIAVFTALTALLSKFIWKAGIYVVVVAANLYALRDLLAFDPSKLAADAMNTTALLIYQVLFLFGLFYLLIDRPWTRFSIGNLE